MLTKTYRQEPHREEFTQFAWIWAPQKEITVFIRKTLAIAGLDCFATSVLVKSKTNLAGFGGKLKCVIFR